MAYFVYILRGSSNQLYIGKTNNLNARIIQHVKKDWKAAKFTKDNNNFQLVYNEEYETRIEAMNRETQLKGWSRLKKEALISGDLKQLISLSKRKIK